MDDKYIDPSLTITEFASTEVVGDAIPSSTNQTTGNGWVRPEPGSNV